MNYLKGKSKPTSALVQLSSIAWHYLESYCYTFSKCPHAKCVKDFIREQYAFLTVDELKVDFEFGKKNHEMIGNNPLTSLQICCWFDIDDFLNYVRVNRDALVCVMLVFGLEKNKSKIVLKFKDYNSTKQSQTKLQEETIYINWPKKCSLTVSGIPKNFLLLSFYINESLVKKFKSYTKKQVKLRNIGMK